MRKEVLFFLFGVLLIILFLKFSFAASTTITTNGIITTGITATNITTTNNATFDSVEAQELNLTEAGITINLNQNKNFLIDGSTNQRNSTLGAIRHLHTPLIPGTRAISFVIDANSQADTKAIVVDFTATSLATGEFGVPLSLNIDTSNSTGGTVHALRVTSVGNGSASVHALHTDEGVIPVHQQINAYGTIESGLIGYDAGGFADVTSNLSSNSDDSTLFSNDNDFLYIGDDSTFNHISVLLETTASHPIGGTFEFSLASGWTEFGPSDGTNGFSNNGIMDWTISQLTDWSNQTVNGTNKYWIRIKRTRNNLNTLPVEDLIQVSAANDFYWKETGNLVINQLNVTGIGDNHFMGNVGLGTDSPQRNAHISDVLRMEPRSGAPTSPALGDIYVDSDSNEFCFYDGTSWTGLKSAGTCA